MYTIIDYIRLRGDLNYDVAPVNEIDQMVYTCMGKPDFSGVIPSEGNGIRFCDAYNAFLKTGETQTKPGLLESPYVKEVLSEAASSKRYKDVVVSHYERKIIDEESEQFSALTIDGPDGIVYVTFRGTDDTLIGWKENCDLAVLDSVAAQKDAKVYLEKIAAYTDKKIIVSGHSKGGNLAIYAAANADPLIQDRIVSIYSFDGPGFMKKFFKTPGYIRIKPKITTFVPKTSVVGMMMSYAGSLKVVDCAKEGIMAHDTFIWGLGTNEFDSAELTAASKSFFVAFNDLIDDMSIEQRQDFIEELFEALSSTGATVLSDLTDQNIKQLLHMANNFRHAKEIKHFVVALAGTCLKEAFENHVKKKGLNPLY